MNKKDNCLKKIENAITELDKAIGGQSELTLTPSRIEQLKAFKIVFLSIVEKIKNGNIPSKNERYLGIGRVIVDQWPLNINLGEILISAEESYREI